MENIYLFIHSFLEFKDKIICSRLNQELRSIEKKNPGIYRQDYIDRCIAPKKTKDSKHQDDDQVYNYCYNYRYRGKCNNLEHWTHVIKPVPRNLKDYKLRIQKVIFKHQKSGIGKSYDGQIESAFTAYQHRVAILRHAFNDMMFHYNQIPKCIDKYINLMDTHENLMNLSEKELYQSVLKLRERYERLHFNHDFRNIIDTNFYEEKEETQEVEGVEEI